MPERHKQVTCWCTDNPVLVYIAYLLEFARVAIHGQRKDATRRTPGVHIVAEGCAGDDLRKPEPQHNDGQNYPLPGCTNHPDEAAHDAGLGFTARRVTQQTSTMCKQTTPKTGGSPKKYTRGCHVRLIAAPRGCLWSGLAGYLTSSVRYASDWRCPAAAVMPRGCQCHSSHTTRRGSIEAFLRSRTKWV
jgi:hypothetical protein